jgi:16S rRNA (cytidine1402-2'-O)-methyltransferase
MMLSMTDIVNTNTANTPNSMDTMNTMNIANAAQAVTAVASTGSASAVLVSESAAAVLAALAADMARQSLPPATLYVLATPIGNRADLTVRAVYVLHVADVVAAEDTRVAGQLLHGLGLHKPLLACDAHREFDAIEGILARLAAGQRVVLCSDAGTPAVSDPGARLVLAARAAGYRVLPIPGVSSLTTALSASGLVGAGGAAGAKGGDSAGVGFTFSAFAPSKGKPRSDFYTALCAAPLPQVWFEAPHRMDDAFALLAKLAPQRSLCIARELTKQFEDIVTLPCADAPAWLAAKPERSRGEFVLTLGAQPATALSDHAVQALALANLLVKELPASKAAALAAKHYGADRSSVYAAMLKEKTV